VDGRQASAVNGGNRRIDNDCLDVVMDPIMSTANYWVWDVQGAFFGIPLQNYWGWWLTVFTTFVLYLLATRNRSPVKAAGSDRLAIAAFMITGYGNIINALTGGLAGPALAGFFALTPWALLAWISTGRNNTQKAI
jgi:putative membrane protein